MSEYDVIDMEYAKEDAFEAGKACGFFAGCCFGGLVGFGVCLVLWSLS